MNTGLGDKLKDPKLFHTPSHIRMTYRDRMEAALKQREGDFE